MAFSSWLTDSIFSTPYQQLTPEQKATRAMQHAEKMGHKMPQVWMDQNDVKESKIRIPEGKTKLSKEELIDKIRGVIYGQAMGDAIGLYTEFHDRSWSHSKYGSQPLNFHASIRGWDIGDWTDDTDQMLLIMDGMIRWNGEIKAIDFASRLWYWVQHGYPELGDYSGNGCGGVVSAAVRSDNFLTDPHACADEVYRTSNGRAAANGAVMRTSILGIPHFYNITDVIKQTLEISKTTHCDPRCSASVVACTTAIALILQGELYDPSHPETIEDVLKQAQQTATLQLAGEESPVEELHTYLNATQLSDLKLDEGSSIGYTYKCIGSGFWATRYGTDFRKTITELILEGGDADTNGAVAGAMLGCKLGYKALPTEWLSTLANRDWLERRVTHFLALLGVHNTTTTTTTETTTHEQTTDNNHHSNNDDNKLNKDGIHKNAI